jgi:hypothetical protein
MLGLLSLPVSYSSSLFAPFAHRFPTAAHTETALLRTIPVEIFKAGLNFHTWQAAFLIRPSLTAWLPSALASYACSTIPQANDQLGFCRLWPRLCALGAWLLWSVERCVANPTRKSQDNPGNPYFCGAEVVKLLVRLDTTRLADDSDEQGSIENRGARSRPAASGFRESLNRVGEKSQIRVSKQQEIARG